MTVSLKDSDSLSSWDLAILRGGGWGLVCNVGALSNLTHDEKTQPKTKVKYLKVTWIRNNTLYGKK